MPLFSDDFERANGGLGANWSVRSGSAGINGGQVGFGNSSFASAGPITGPGTAMAECILDLTAAANPRGGPFVKGQADGAGGYFTYITYSAPNTTYGIYRWNGATATAVATNTVAEQLTGAHTVRLTYAGGTLTMMVDGNIKVSGSNTVWSANSLIGIFQYNTAVVINSFNGAGDGAPALYITPNVVGTDDGDQALGFYCTGLTYTPGSPGSPALTVNAGALTSQEITDTAHGSFIFSPPTSAQTVTVLDSTNGVSAAITVVDGTYLGSGGTNPYFLPVDVLAWLSDQAKHGGLVVSEQKSGDPDVTEGIYVKGAFGEVLLGKRAIVGDNPAAYDPALLVKIWGILNGRDDEEEGNTVLGNAFIAADRSDTILDRMSFAKTEGSYDVGTLMREIAGLPGGSIQDVLDAIAELPTTGGGDNTDVLEAIGTLRGDSSTSVHGVAELLGQLATLDAYNLGDVKEWIGTPSQTPDAATAIAVVALIAALALAAPTGGASVAAAAVAVGAGPVLDVATIVELVGVLSELAAVAADIANIKSNLETPPTVNVNVAPVWPGEDGVTYGTAVSLGAGGTITETMDGVVIDIDHCDTDHRPAYNYDGQRAWRNIGALAFADDAGHVELYQQLTFEHGIYTPKSMAHASAVYWFTSHGPVGTIQPWIVEPA